MQADCEESLTSCYSSEYTLLPVRSLPNNGSFYSGRQPLRSFGSELRTRSSYYDTAHHPFYELMVKSYVAYALVCTDHSCQPDTSQHDLRDEVWLQLLRRVGALPTDHQLYISRRTLPGSAITSRDRMGLVYTSESTRPIPDPFRGIFSSCQKRNLLKHSSTHYGRPE